MYRLAIYKFWGDMTSNQKFVQYSMAFIKIHRLTVSTAHAYKNIAKHKQTKW